MPSAGPMMSAAIPIAPFHGLVGGAATHYLYSFYEV